MKDIIVDRINSLKHYTKNNIQELSKANIPYLSDIKLIEQYSYRLEGKTYVCPSNCKIFMSMNLPYSSIPNSTDNTYSMSFLEAVNYKDIFPILLFINGKFIKWSDITLIKDSFYSYLIVNEIDDLGDSYAINTITIPEIRATYTEDVKTVNITSGCIFFFDKLTDLYVSSPAIDGIYTTISIDNTLDISVYKNTVYSNNRFYIPESQKIEKDSVFIFNEGLLYDPNKIIDYPLNIFNVISTTKTMVRILSFSYINGNSSKDNDTSIVNISNARTRLLAEQDSDFFTNISERFNFDFNSKDSETNMTTALKYIMNYNPVLMNQVYKDASHIKSITYTGKEMINVVNSSDGYIHLSRKLSDNFDCYMIIFKNGYLYDDYKNARYRNNEFLFKINVTSTNATDVFEILYFLDIDNRIMETRLWSGEDDTVILDPDFNLDNLIIASPTPHNNSFNIDTNNDIVYTLDFEANRVTDGTANIILKDSFYYDKLLYFGSKKQFRYYCKYNTESKTIYDFILPDEFKLCNKKEGYMIFINGVYIDQSLYSVTISNEEDPFYILSLYMDIGLKINDKLELFYIGNVLNKVYENTDKINTSGNIILDSSKLKYPFDNDLYLIFIDGRKSLPSEITNIDSQKLNITTTSSNIISRVSIIQFVEENELLYSFFNNNSDLLSTTIGSLSDSDLTALFSSSTISVDLPINSLDLDDRMLRIVRDYWMKAYINNGDEMPISFNNYYSDNQIIDTGNLSDD